MHGNASLPHWCLDAQRQFRNVQLSGSSEMFSIEIRTLLLRRFVGMVRGTSYVLMCSPRYHRTSATVVRWKKLHIDHHTVIQCVCAKLCHLTRQCCFARSWLPNNKSGGSNLKQRKRKPLNVWCLLSSPAPTFVAVALTLCGHPVLSDCYCTVHELMHVCSFKLVLHAFLLYVCMCVCVSYCICHSHFASGTFCSH